MVSSICIRCVSIVHVVYICSLIKKGTMCSVLPEAILVGFWDYLESFSSCRVDHQLDKNHYHSGLCT